MRDLRLTLLDALEAVLAWTAIALLLAVAWLARRAARGLDSIARAAGRPIEWSE
jgi:hypothetical protein